MVLQNAISICHLEIGFRKFVYFWTILMNVIASILLKADRQAGYGYGRI